jgi:hypothetical protein
MFTRTDIDGCHLIIQEWLWCSIGYAVGLCKAVSSYRGQPLLLQQAINYAAYGTLIMDVQIAQMLVLWMANAVFAYSVTVPLLILLPMAVAQHRIYVRLWGKADNLSSDTFRSLVRFCIVWTGPSPTCALLHLIVERQYFHAYGGGEHKSRSQFVISTALSVFTLLSLSATRFPSLLWLALLGSLCHYEVPTCYKYYTMYVSNAEKQEEHARPPPKRAAFPSAGDVRSHDILCSNELMG